MFSLGQLKSEDNNNDRTSKVILLKNYGVCEMKNKEHENSTNLKKIQEFGRSANAT
jgi:hypothetical protein